MSDGSTIGVCIFPPPDLNKGRTVNYPEYVHELLRHAGVLYEIISVDALEQALPKLGLLVTVGDYGLAEAMRDQLRQWVRGGGAWLAIGGTCGMEDVFGAKIAAPTYSGWGGGARSLGEGYLVAECQHIITEFIDKGGRQSISPSPGTPGEGGGEGISAFRVQRSAFPGSCPHPDPLPEYREREEDVFPAEAKAIHFFGGCSVVATDGTVLARALDKHGRSDGSPAMIEKKFGDGRALLICVDVPGTVVRIQQGICVTRDGVAARDGSAPVDDSVLKSGDGGVLDWYFDRDEVAGAAGLQAFLRPQADAWREILLRTIFYLASEKNLPVYVLWIWPRNLPAIGHISHDSDGNDPALAEVLLKSLERCEIKSTWCVIAPGYSPEVIGKIREAGQELAMHYDAMTPGLNWGEEEFEKQWRELSALLGNFITNKNHYLRWQGDMEFFAWCERRGIQLDQSKGPSKTGEAGFNFGTSQPYFPVSFEGKISPVLELTTHTQDLGVFAPAALGMPLLLASLDHHGVAHFLFHPAHFAKPQAVEGMAMIVREGKQRGMEWWTARQINDWVRARRNIRWQFDSEDSLTVTAEMDLAEVTILSLGSSTSMKVNDQALGADHVRRWGFDFAGVTLNLPGRNEPDGLSPSPGTPGEGGGEGTSAFSVQRSAFPDSCPHPNPLPEYRARGPEKNGGEI